AGEPARGAAVRARHVRRRAGDERELALERRAGREDLLASRGPDGREDVLVRRELLGDDQRLTGVELRVALDDAELRVVGFVRAGHQELDPVLLLLTHGGCAS